MSIEIMHVDFQTHGTNILEVLQKSPVFFFLTTLHIKMYNLSQKYSKPHDFDIV